MFLSDAWRDFEVLDAGEGMKLERWGDYLLARAGYNVDNAARFWSSEPKRL